MIDKASVRLARSKDTFDLMHEAESSVFDDPRYMFLLSADYIMKKQEDSGGWHNDAYCIYSGDVLAGFIQWNINRTHECIDGVTVMVLPPFLNSGIGVIALAKWLLYIFEYRKTRKVEFGACVDNPVSKIYDRVICKIGGRKVGVALKDLKLVDNAFHDKAKYEILGSDFNPEPVRKIASRG